MAILLLTYGLIENLSDGNLSLRYLGETESTINQAREKTINIVTTGRYDLLISDLKLIDNFVLVLIRCIRLPKKLIILGGVQLIQNFQDYYVSMVFLA